MSSAKFVCIWVACAFLLMACSDSSDDDLQSWMLEQRNNLKPMSEPVLAPKKFNPQIYSQEGKVEPFGSQKLMAGLRSDYSNPASNSSLIAPELSRRKQALEAYPLDVMSYVGSLQKGLKKSALLRVDRLIYQVEPGAYIGQNYGKIMEITESEIILREISQDAAGEWIERQATLKLQEAK